jgi:PAS domain-containing protein
MIAAPTDRIGAAMCRLAVLRQQATSIGRDCPAVVDDALAAVQELIGQLKNAIEEVKQAEEQTAYGHSSANRARRQYEETIALIPLPFLQTNGSGTILSLNEPAARLLNLSRPHAIGKTLSLFIAGDRGGFAARLAELSAPNRIDGWPLQIRPREKPCVQVTATACASTRDEHDETVVWLLAPIVDPARDKRAPRRAHGSDYRPKVTNVGDTSRRA